MKAKLKRALVAMTGSIVLLLGIIMIPYPGPGWVVVFAGLGILATEFDWAKRLLEYAKSRYDGWLRWVAKQPIIVRGGIICATALVVILTIWLVNGYGVINHLFHLGWNQVDSPLPFFN